MVEIVFLIPFLAGIIAFFLSPRAGRLLLVTTGLVHLVPRAGPPARIR